MGSVKFSHNRVRCAGAGGDSGRHQLCDFHHCQLSATRRQFQRQQPQNRSVLPHYPTKQRDVPRMHVTPSIRIQHALMNSHSGLQACLCLEDVHRGMHSLTVAGCSLCSCRHAHMILDVLRSNLASNSVISLPLLDRETLREHVFLT